MYFNVLIFFSVLAIVAATAIPETAQFEALPQVLHGGEALANASPALNARHLMKRDSEEDLLATAITFTNAPLMATAASLAIASHAMIVASLAAKRTVKFHIM
ncbi:hypothetical protein BGZ97_007256, partial [Linnemannia gamsii]